MAYYSRPKRASRKTMTEMVMMKMMIVMMMMMKAGCWCCRLVMRSHPPNVADCCFSAASYFAVYVDGYCSPPKTSVRLHASGSTESAGRPRVCVRVWERERALVSSVEAWAAFHPPALTLCTERKVRQETLVQTYVQCSSFFRHTWRHAYTQLKFSLNC